MKRLARLSGSLLLVASLGMGGCSSEKQAAKAPQTPASVASTPAPSAKAAPQAPPVESPSLRVSDEIARLCNLPRTQSAPSFDYDSTDITTQDKEILAVIAKCVTEGALKGKSLSLVGRADPRGETEYNMGLGGSRADSVRKYMRGMGVQDQRMITTSRGELDATGTDEAGWAKDRRVDINVAH